MKCWKFNQLVKNGSNRGSSAMQISTGLERTDSPISKKGFLISKNPKILLIMISKTVGMQNVANPCCIIQVQFQSPFANRLLIGFCSKCKKITPRTLGKIQCFSAFFGVPGGIRTHGLSLRRRTLYPAELQRHSKTIFNLNSIPSAFTPEGG